MAKNANFVSHKKSKLKENGGPKLPLASDLVEGEIAINFGKDVETLSIKNESGDVVTFSSDNYYSEKKLGSGFTGTNSGKSVTDVIVENEEIISSALNDLDDRKLDASAITEYWVSGTGENSVILKNSSGTASGDYAVAEGKSTTASGNSSHAEGYITKANGDYSHAEGNNTTASGNSSHAEGNSTIANNNSEHASGQYNVSSSASTTFGNSGNTLFSVGNGISNAKRHNAFEIRQNGDIYIVNKEGNDVKLQDEIGNITIDQVIDSGTSASTDAVSTSAVYGFVTSYTPSITVDQDFSNTASTNPISTKAVYSAVTDNELVWTNAYVTLSGTVSAHTANTEIHVTAAEKTKLESITGTVGTMAYENKGSYSSATQVNTALAGKSDTGHTHVSSGVTAMTGYAKAASGSSITTSDTLNQAIGKLEAYVDDLNSQSETVAAALVDLYNKIGDIETLLSQI